MIRVGINGKTDTAEFPDYHKVVCLTKSSAYGDLSPYCLTVNVDEYDFQAGEVVTLNNVNMENAWQFSKLYAAVPASRQTRSRYDSTVIWQHPAERHLAVETVETVEAEAAASTTVSPSAAYWRWRHKGMLTVEPVRYPVGFEHRHQCLCSLWYDKDSHNYDQLDYIAARKAIYVPLYLRAVVGQPKFIKLQQMLAAGKNLLILEVDGPHQESLSYYQTRYAVSSDFISNYTTLATPANLQILLEDAKHPFGHGYCLAMALLGLDVKSLS